MRLALILCLAATASASAQTTWHNLHFGQSRDAVTAELTNQNMPSTSSDDGTLQVSTDFEELLPGLRYPLPLIVTVHFNANSALSDVTLALDLPAARHYWSSIGSDEALFNFAAEHFTGALSGRYGAPLFSSNSCDGEPKQASTFCIISWRGAEQTVEMERSVTAKGPRLLIRYQPLAGDL